MLFRSDLGGAHRPGVVGALERLYQVVLVEERPQNALGVDHLAVTVEVDHPLGGHGFRGLHHVLILHSIIAGELPVLLVDVEAEDLDDEKLQYYLARLGEYLDNKVFVSLLKREPEAACYMFHWAVIEQPYIIGADGEILFELDDDDDDDDDDDE